MPGFWKTAEEIIDGKFIPAHFLTTIEKYRKLLVKVKLYGKKRRTFSCCRDDTLSGAGPEAARNSRLCHVTSAVLITSSTRSERLYLRALVLQFKRPESDPNFTKLFSNSQMPRLQLIVMRPEAAFPVLWDDDSFFDELEKWTKCLMQNYLRWARKRFHVA